MIFRLTYADNAIRGPSAGRRAELQAAQAGPVAKGGLEVSDGAGEALGTAGWGYMTAAARYIPGRQGAAAQSSALFISPPTLK